MIDWLNEQQNITLLIALIGCSISIYNFVKDFFQSLNRISIDYRSHQCIISLSQKAQVTVGLIFSNLSAKPVSITRMYLKHHKKLYEFAFPANLVYEFTERSGNEIINKKRIESQQLPFRIDGLGAVGGYFMVYLPQEMENDFNKLTTLTLLIYTNRGKKRISISAMNYGYDAEDYGYPREN